MNLNNINQTTKNLSNHSFLLNKTQSYTIYYDINDKHQLHLDTLKYDLFT